MKWMLVNVDLSVLYLSKPDALREAISLTPDYLRSREDPDVPNFNDYSIALGRRFRALKLWFTMRCYGREDMAAMLRGHNAQAQWLKEQVEADPRFELAAPVHLSLVTLRLKSGDEATQRLVEEINASGIGFLSQTVLAGKLTIRVAIGNFMTAPSDVAAVWRRMQQIADNLIG
jgi:aromatic-L-amino-acid decarboxylase